MKSNNDMLTFAHSHGRQGAITNFDISFSLSKGIANRRKYDKCSKKKSFHGNLKNVEQKPTTGRIHTLISCYTQ